MNDCILTLQSKDDVGLTGPINNNPRLLTQSFVSRKHKDMFGYYFPPEIINWFCDDWINDVYKNIGHFFPLNNHKCDNVGGQPRYEINNDETFIKNMKVNWIKTKEYCNEIVKRDVKNLNK